MPTPNVQRLTESKIPTTPEAVCSSVPASTNTAAMLIISLRAWIGLRPNCTRRPDAYPPDKAPISFQRNGIQASAPTAASVKPFEVTRYSGSQKRKK